MTHCSLYIRGSHQAPRAIDMWKVGPFCQATIRPKPSPRHTQMIDAPQNGPEPSQRPADLLRIAPK
jgi:hypothetical protein